MTRFIAIALLITLATCANAAVSVSFGNDNVRVGLRVGHTHHHTVRTVQSCNTVRYVQHVQPVRVHHVQTVHHVQPARHACNLPTTLVVAGEILRLHRWERCGNGWRGIDGKGILRADAYNGRISAAIPSAPHTWVDVGCY
jgi:hypothetical protein